MKQSVELGRHSRRRNIDETAGIVAAGPIPAIHGVVRWRVCDLIMRLYEEFGLSVSDDTIYRALKKLGFSLAIPRALQPSSARRLSLAPVPKPLGKFCCLSLPMACAEFGRATARRARENG
jgi:hypothetical protein